MKDKTLMKREITLLKHLIRRYESALINEEARRNEHSTGDYNLRRIVEYWKEVTNKINKLL